MVKQWYVRCRYFFSNLARSASTQLGQCWLCAGVGPVSAGCCKTCFRDLPRLPPVNLRPSRADDYCRVWLAALSYQPPIDTWIHQFKFRAQPYLVRHLAPLLAAQIVVYHKQQRRRMPQYLVPVPMPLRRWQQRGYNQALLLCQALSALLGIPYVTGLQLSAKAAREQRAQHQLTRAQRQQRLTSRYQCRHRFRGGHVAVVDDIITSGSTLNAAAVALLEAGADEVSGWALAYTPAGHEV